MRHYVLDILEHSENGAKLTQIGFLKVCFDFVLIFMKFEFPANFPSNLVIMSENVIKMSIAGLVNALSRYLVILGKF